MMVSVWELSVGFGPVGCARIVELTEWVEMH
jgi:hypothetical protein